MNVCADSFRISTVTPIGLSSATGLLIQIWVVRPPSAALLDQARGLVMTGRHDRPNSSLVKIADKDAVLLYLRSHQVNLHHGFAQTAATTPLAFRP